MSSTRPIRRPAAPLVRLALHARLTLCARLTLPSLRCNARLNAAAILACAALTVGCGTTRQFTFVADPPDATVRVSGPSLNVVATDRPVALTFTQPTQTFDVTARRFGFEDATQTIDLNTPAGPVRLALKPQTKPITLFVEPVAGDVTLDGRSLSTAPVDSMTFELPFAIDDSGQPLPRRVRAARAGFAPVEGTINWTDPTARYVLKLEPLKKDLTLTTEPSGARLTLDGVDVGTSPVALPGQSFPYDVTTEKFVGRKLVASRPGYAPTELTLGWDDGQTTYDVKLQNLRKTMNFVVDPPDAVLKFDGKELKPDDNGARTVAQTFPPLDDAGTLPTHRVEASLTRPGEIWRPTAIDVGWDEGKPQYVVKLQEILTRVVPVGEIAFAIDPADGRWKPSPAQRDTAGVKDVTDGDLGAPARVTDLPAGTNIGSFAVSPDGTLIVYSVLDLSDAKRPRSRLALQRTDGTGGVTQLTDGRGLDLTPSFSPAGDRIVFSSDRGGGHLHLWSVAVDGAGGVTRLSIGEADHFWPSLDSNPKPTVFYEARLPNQPEPRLFSSGVGTSFETDLVKLPAFQPRLSPRNDAVVFTSVNATTGKRDVYRVSSKGLDLTALTSTPDVDERDPAWNADGSRVAYAAESPTADHSGVQLDIYVMTQAGTEARPVTHNDSLDDQPVFDPSGDAIYFRSNRGGKWDVWRTTAK